MRQIAVVLAASVLATGCATNSYTIPGTELQRLAATAPEARGQHVRVVQDVQESDVDQAQPVSGGAEVMIFPEPNVYGPERGRYYAGGGGGWSGGSWSGGGGGVHVGGVSHGGPGVKSGGGGGHGLGSLGSGGGDGKAEAIAILAAAAVVLVAAAAIEGSRFDGYANLHPMMPVHLVGRDGQQTVMPLAWIDPQTAAWTDHAVVRDNEGPFQSLERAPLDRRGWTYAMLGGAGTYKSVDGSTGTGTSTAIQLGFFPEQRIGVVGTVFFGWRDNAVAQTLFESRYTLELDAYPVQAGPLHLGVYGGGGGAQRWEDYPGVDGNEGTVALLGGALMQLDINTRLALTARLGVTQAHSETMKDAMFGLSVY